MNNRDDKNWYTHAGLKTERELGTHWISSSLSRAPQSKHAALTQQKEVLLPCRWRCPEDRGEVLSLREELRNKSYMEVPQPSGLRGLKNKGTGGILICWQNPFSSEAL